MHALLRVVTLEWNIAYNENIIAAITGFCYTFWLIDLIFKVFFYLILLRLENEKVLFL